LSWSTWHRRSILVGLGALGALALPPFHMIFFLFPALTGLIWLITRASLLREAFGAGWWFGLGHGVLGYYWITNAFMVDASAHGFLAPIAIGFLSSTLAIFSGLPAAGAWWLCRWRKSGPISYILVFTALWGTGEWTRSWFLTGFPWNIIATSWTFSPDILQSAAVIGPYGLGMLTIVVAGMPSMFLIGNSRRMAGGLMVTSLFLFLLVWAAGHKRLDSSRADFIDGVGLRLIQPNIPQHLKWHPDLRIHHVNKQMQLSMAPIKNISPTHIIWPETAIPFNLSSDAPLRQLIAKVVPSGGLLITGAPRTQKLSKSVRHSYNSVHAVDETGSITASYDKQHLVPFGEYVPLRWLLGFSKLTAGRLDFHKGRRPRLIDLAGLPLVSILICYEIIFPAEVGDMVKRPSWLLNLTNDAWFGLSAGPHQHLASAQMRAVEQGLPVVRVANTGISAVIDPYGRILSSLSLGVDGTLDSQLPKPLKNPALYGKFGDWLTLLHVLILAGSIWLPSDGRKSNREKTERP